MGQDIKGHFYEAGSSASVDVIAREQGDGTILILDPDSEELLRRSNSQEYELGMVIPNVAVEVSFSDGALFQPLDREFRWQSLEKNQSRLLETLESNLMSVVFAIVSVPVVLWWVITIGIPAGAERMVSVLPHSVAVQASQQTLLILDKTAFDESELDDTIKQPIVLMWQDALNDLNKSPENYHLEFRASEAFGANAFALPDGTVVVTDDLATLLKDKPKAMLAILLHEIGHVEHQHGMQMVARSTVTTLFFAIFFGDIDGAGELVIGASSSLIDNAFSRDMESEADQFAIEELKALGYSPEAFAEAMEALLEEHGDGEDYSPFLRYLSSHPDTQERIDAAKQ